MNNGHSAEHDRSDRHEEFDSNMGANDTDPIESPVEAVVSAFLDYLEDHGHPPVLDNLSPTDRHEAESLIEAIRGGRGIKPHTSTPSLEELLAGTDMEWALPTLSAGQPNASAAPGLDAALDGRSTESIDRGLAHTDLIAGTLRGADSRVNVLIKPNPLAGPAVTASYLDLRAVFFAIDSEEPVITSETRELVDRIFDADPELERVGVVAVGSGELLTQVLSCGDLGSSVVTPSDEMELQWSPVLPLSAALRRLLEAAAPSWEPCVLNPDLHAPLDLARVATQVAQKVLARELKRPYRGEKGQAYKSFMGKGEAFANLTVTLGLGAAGDEDIEVALNRIVQDAA